MLLHQPCLSLDGNVCDLSIHKGEHWDFHFHKNVEVIYVIKGSVECTINNKSDIINSGEFSMCLSNEIHSGRSVGDAVFWAFIFSEDYVQSFSRHVKGKVGEGFKFTCREPVLKYLEEVFINDNPKDIFTQKASLYAICGEYLNCVKLVDKKNANSEAMTAIVDYISKNYTNNIRLNDVSDMLNYDYHYVSRLFHQLFNMSFNNFVNMYRLEKAVELMAKENHKLIDVAHESGFQSIRTFNSCFKAYYGINPTEYKHSGR